MNAIERAAAAKALLEDATFRAVFDEVRGDLITKIETAPFADGDVHHELTLALQALNSIKRRLDRWIDDGKMEQKAVEQENWREKMIARARKGLRV